MRFLVLSDFHNYEGIIDSLIIRGEEFDVILCLGDYEFYNEDVYDRIVPSLKGISRQLFMIPGNIDLPDIVVKFEELGVNLHNKREVFENFTFIGYGGSNPTPFNTPFEVSEEVIQKDLNKLCKEKIDSPWILVTHAPAIDTKVDSTRFGKHVGSKSIRRIINEYHPTVALSGHIHEAFGVDRINNTILVNPGPAHDQRAAIIDIINDEIEVKLIKV